MKRPLTSFESSLRAFRDVTGAPADGAATRARVLARVGRARLRRASWRRFGPLLLATVVVSASASAAWTTVSSARRPVPPTILKDPPDVDTTSGRGDVARFARPRALTIPPVPLPPEAPAGDDATSSFDAEARVYARAHRAHFVEDDPARALVAWNEYLRRFPRGTLSPEAEFNRALCLVHLDRRAEATRALQSFADSHRDGYRRAEVERLLGWLNARARVPR